MTKDTSFVLICSISFLSVKYSSRLNLLLLHTVVAFLEFSTCQVETLKNLKIPHLLPAAPEGAANPTRLCGFLANTAVFQT